MTHFVRDNTTIAGPKQEWDEDEAKTALTNPEMFCRSSDYNDIRQGMFDLRDWIQTGLTPGTFARATLTVDSDGRITGVAAGAALATIATSGSASDLSGGTVAAARMPALTGDVTTSAGAVATTIANNAVTNAKLAQMATLTLKGNNTGGTANALDLTTAQVLTMLGIGASSPFYFNAGSDGAAVMDGATAVTGATLSGGNTYTATRDVYWTNVTISTSVTFKPDGFRFYINGTLTGAGTAAIDASGGNASAGTAGVCFSSNNRPLPNGLAGGSAASNSTGAAGGTSGAAPRGASITAAPGGSGGGGSAGTAGGSMHGGGGGGISGGAGGSAGGTLALAPLTAGDWRELESATTGWQLGDTNAGTGTRSPFTAGSGGGAGGSTTALGGGGGAGGGWLVGYIHALSGTVAFRSKGGDGGIGTSGAFGGGGGGGGGGGIVVLVLGPGVTPPAPTVTGGAGGAPGSGGTPFAGGAGGDGQFQIFQ